jgi:hypothetical protein
MSSGSDAVHQRHGPSVWSGPLAPRVPQCPAPVLHLDRTCQAREGWERLPTCLALSTHVHKQLPLASDCRRRAPPGSTTATLGKSTPLSAPLSCWQSKGMHHPLCVCCSPHTCRAYVCLRCPICDCVQRRPLGAVEELRAMSVPRQELYLSSIVHAINWFRAVVNVYHDQVCG